MAASTLPEPGKIVRGEEIGPCIEPCEHTDCAATRRMAETHCSICGQVIGYETLFYDIGQRKPMVSKTLTEDLVHAICHEMQVREEKDNEEG
jgi:hypothetical protein